MGKLVITRIPLDVINIEVFSPVGFYKRLWFNKI